MRRLALAAAPAVALLAACSGPSDPVVSTAPFVTPSVGHGALAYCLGQHGIPAPPGPVSGPPAGVDPADWEAAMSACSSLAPGPSNTAAPDPDMERPPSR
ncbi:hypothetical protein Mycch_4475 [Mycolicibacterium chubuense NBB4]|uniref:Lipoprotein n=1 Tax=Mycolicibacterium chubuense (strain NBB4) TaxID=710421 RepID=I4BPH3_MYCCN|nr:hypothetical protein [Mycolicibacterium chubuense]AFM19180.1 hypothetical protein Mycch_4475 [Mycolicibacterium chubuense NBB4]